MKHGSRIIALSIGLLLLGGLLVAFYPRSIASAKGNDKVTKKASVPATVTTVPQDQDKQPQGAVGGMSYQNDVSPPLSEMKPVPIQSRPEREANANPWIFTGHKDSPDTVVQKNFSGLLDIVSTPNMPATILNFDGIPFPGVACNCAPPDTDGEVGQTQFVQIVNEGFQVFNKTTGASILGPVGISTVWAGFGGACQTGGFGDPIVLYDQLANRWLISQFASATGGTPITDECIAISQTNDATGAYNRYGFHLGSNFFDYPKLSVWPDGYYMSMNVFNSTGTAFLGPQAFAFQRSAMLTGAAAIFVTPGITGGPTENPFLPADLDGSTLPAGGAPNTFVEFPGTGAYKLFHFHADFGIPANTTFTLFATLPAAPFTQLCPATRACVPQLGSTSNLDGIGDRLMHRLAYRNFGPFEALVGNFSVSSGGVSGVRWFELRNPTAGPATVFQESTYQPDTTWRWMGSIAQDQSGDMALGYSASSATINPQIRYAGRLAGDPLNTLPQAEVHLFDGTGSQTGTSNRWGDYSAMSIDPVDDCTFWYTQEYYSTTSSFNWRTRIGNFKFPTCNGVPTPIITPNGQTLVNESCPPTNGAVDPGENVTMTLKLQNSGTGATTNLVATLVATANVLDPTGPVSYGAIAPGNTVGRDFSFTANGNCGDIITLTLQLQDGVNNLGTATYQVRLGTLVTTTAFSENFDGVVAPALPAGWTTAASGVESPWVTSTTTPNSAPNDAFAPDPNNIGNTELVSPTIAIGAAGAQLTFKNNYNTESTFDGMVLEISINGGAFADIITAGGSFVTGGYNATISSAFGSPIAGRQAWSGNSGGYITTTVNLPPAASGQNINLKWRMASDNSVAVVGVRIDDISISSTVAVCNLACTGAPRISTSFALSCSGANTVATITIANSGTGTATGVNLTVAKLGGVSGTPLPQSIGSLAPGASSVRTVTFTGAPSGATTLQIGGTYTGGSYNSSRKVTAPNCASAQNHNSTTNAPWSAMLTKAALTLLGGM